MATKRMFSRDIIQSDAFLDMPSSTQSLYFHLGMEADDDGFVGNPKRLQKIVGCGDDDMKILISKRFVLVFPSGVIVVKHHRINNNWDKYNCKRTVYRDEFNQLYLKDNRAYSLDSSKGVPLQSAISLETGFRREENREEKNTERLASPRRVLSTSKETATPLQGVQLKNMAFRRVKDENEHFDDASIDADTGVERGDSLTAPKKGATAKNRVALALCETFKTMALDTAGRNAVTGQKDYYRALAALRVLDKEQVETLFLEWFSRDSVPFDLVGNMAAALSDKNIASFKDYHGL